MKFIMMKVRMRLFLYNLMDIYELILDLVKELIIIIDNKKVSIVYLKIDF